MPPVRTGPVIGLIAQSGLLALLATTIGLGVAGWVTGAAYGLIVSAALIWGLHRAGLGGFGPADWVTQTRALLVGGAAALVADALVADALNRSVPVGLLVAIASLALLLDWLDGQVARRTDTVSGFGARFDMEVDAFLLLVLSLAVMRSVGVWVLAIGLMRYAYVAAGWALPWLRRPVPPRYWRKVVTATVGVVLVVAVADVLPLSVTVVALAAALALLCESFGRDIVWLWRHRRQESVSI